MPAWWKPSPKEGKISDKKIQEDKKSKKNESESDDRIISLSSGGGGGGSASNFCPDFDLGDKHVYPLPSPVSSALSSVSSSSSSDEPPFDLGLGIHRYSDQFNTPRGRSLKSVKQQQQPTIENRQLLSTSPVADHSDVFLHSNDGSSSIAKSGFSTFPRTGLQLRSTPHSLAPSPRARSPGPESRGRAFSTSPLHPRMARLSLDLMDAKLEGGKISCHPLPLPPGFPNSSPAHSPSSSAGPLSSRSSGGTENTVSLRSKWKKGKLLGRGTFGHVFVGFNSESGQMCAIKEVRVISDDQNSKESLRQLGQEITMLSHLSHPNIVQYYGSEMAEETLAVYLEYVSGGSIHKLLQEYGPFKEPVIRIYTAQILSGIAYLHGRNTVHRDIKGANILVDPNGEVKLADFGMAKHMTSCSSILSFKGSPFWMAPEVIMNSNGYGLAVDIWSLGCTVLEMATCKPPWSQYEGVAAIFKIGNSKDIPPIPDNISDDGKNFVMLCLQRDPSKRPTAAQLLEHPFVRDQTTGKVANISFNKDIMPSPSDNNPKQNTVDFHNSKGNHPLHDGDYDINHMVGFPFTSKISSEHASTRMNMSLPVSPCSSPLRQQLKNSNRSCWLSPPHPAYAMGTGSYDLSNYSAYAPRTSGGVLRKPKTNFLDSWPDMKAQTPDGSPRTRSMEGW